MGMLEADPSGVINRLAERLAGMEVQLAAHSQVVAQQQARIAELEAQVDAPD
jgi:uncharacterized coiled-coil protein SlyX